MFGPFSEPLYVDSVPKNNMSSQQRSIERQARSSDFIKVGLIFIFICLVLDVVRLG